MNKLNFSQYLSPFTWRYSSSEMRTIFSEEYKIKLWRKIWVALAQAQYEEGLLTKKEFFDLKNNEKNFDIERILVIEKETKHDLVAAIKEFAEKAKIGGGKIHLGATSMDIVDNAEIIRIKEALKIIEKRLEKILLIFAKLIKKYASLPCLGYTHLQPAEPTTVGYRLSFYAQDFLNDYILTQFINKNIIKAKGFKGAVGTSASYCNLLKDKKTSAQRLEKKVLNYLGIDALLITSQVYSRKVDFWVLSLLASICQSASKFTNDLRILQSPVYGEWSEFFEKKQVGSSAMPFKKNPINSEKISSLARYVNFLPIIALENASLSYLERTLDDSANRRVIIPESFLATDEILITLEKIISNLNINKRRIIFNLNQFAPFLATESILNEAVTKGANRQVIHEILRNISLNAWAKIQLGKPNPMKDLILKNKIIYNLIKKEKLIKFFNVENYIGDAAQRALNLVKKIKKLIKNR